MPTLTLNDKIESITRLTHEQKTGLKKIHLETISDLLRYYPVNYGDVTKAVPINSVQRGSEITVFGKIHDLKTSKGFKTKIPMAKAVLEDESGKIGLVWFNQPYIAKMIHNESLVRVVGKLSEGKNGKYFSNPQIEEIEKIPEINGVSLFGNLEDTNATEINSSAPLYPIYPETKYITSNWMFHTLQKIFRSGALDRLNDPIPEHILSKYSLPSLKTALLWIHAPHKINDYEIARKRLAFEEVFLIQLQKQIEKNTILNMPSIKITDAKKHSDEFVSKLPFELTKAQTNAVDTIVTEIQRGVPMSRLLEGDVGSGKTAVAAATSYAIVKSHPYSDEKIGGFGYYQIAYMAPTEILATQQFESFIKFFKHLPIEIALVTGSVCKKFPSKTNPDQTTTISKSQMLKWIEEGKISVVIGTHALIQKKVKFKNLAYVIIDEQHRFGVNQRQKLARKDNIIPHLLSMTATPIPRTLALTIYGDLDLSLLDEMPKGRKKINTEIVTPEKREEVYRLVRQNLNEGRQVYVICPRIESEETKDMPLSDDWQPLTKDKMSTREQVSPNQKGTLQLRSVKEEALRLKKEVFPEFKIDILHSKMTPTEKDKTMEKFYKGEIDILVSTSVVEVGVNVPNATVIIIEGAERFGLSQLHQLRGRVLRGNHDPYCFVFANSKSDKSIERLRAFKNAKNGFELAELDLKQRGAGTLGAGKQWGISDIAMEALRNLKMVEAAREEAKTIAKNDLQLNSYPLLRQILSTKKEIHFE